jgi:hypothetical protein
MVTELAIMVVAAIAFGVAASMLVQWTSGRSAVAAIGIAVLVVLVLATAAVILVRIAAARVH